MGPQGFQLVIKNETAPEDFRPDKASRLNPVVKKNLAELKVKKAVFKRRAALQAFKNYRSPKIRLHSAKVSGPHYESWPPISHQNLYTSGNNLKVLTDFAEKAFRRPLKEGELTPYLSLLKDQTTGLKNAFISILCSPQFLYLEENEGQLNNYAIASRLSYFLWNSMPDRTLLELAKLNKLKIPMF